MSAGRWLGQLFWSERRGYAQLTVVVVLVALLEMLPPYLIGRAVNLMSAPGFSLKPVLLLLALWAAGALALQVLHGAQIGLAATLGERLLARNRRDVFVQLQRVPMAYFDRASQGQLLSQIGTEINAMSPFLNWGLNHMVIYSGYAVVATVLLATIHPSLLLAIIWLPPLAIALSVVYTRRLDVGWSRARDSEARLAGNQEENIRGARVVAAFNRQRENLDAYNELQELNSQLAFRLGRDTGRLQIFTQLVRFCGLVLILGFGAYLARRGEMTAGDLVSASLYWEWLMVPATGLGPLANDWLACASVARRLHALLTLAPEPADPPGARELPPLRERLRFNNVTFSYREGQPVLNAVDFEIHAGQTVALVGATGSGKSTILSLLARFYEPDSGAITVDGVDIAAATRASLHAHMAIVLQTNFIFKGTVLDNIRFAAPTATLDDVVEAVKQLHCYEFITSLPQGFDTPIGEGGAALSLGERQLICFARALVANPRLLLLDEATSSLDPELDLRIQDALFRLVHGRTTFIVTHRLATAVRADLILFLEHGRLVERGSHRELLAAGGRYSRLYRDSLEHPEQSLDERLHALDHAP